MKTLLIFNFERYYPGGGADDLRAVLRVEGDVEPSVILEAVKPFDGEYVNAVLLDGAAEHRILRWKLVRAASPDAAELRDAVVKVEAPRWGTDVNRWVGLVPWNH